MGRERWQVEVLFAGHFLRDLIARIGMAHDAGGGIFPQHAF
jgi:hypothetical protein